METEHSHVDKNHITIFDSGSKLWVIHQSTTSSLQSSETFHTKSGVLLKTPWLTPVIGARAVFYNSVERLSPLCAESFYRFCMKQTGTDPSSVCVWRHFSLHVWGLTGYPWQRRVMHLTFSPSFRWCTSALSSRMWCCSVSWSEVCCWREQWTASLTCSLPRWEQSRGCFLWKAGERHILPVAPLGFGAILKTKTSDISCL